jgi:hypothetical protein
VQTWVEESVTFSVNIQDDVSMTLAAIELSEANLIFDYTIVNNSPYLVYLINSLFDSRGPAGFQLDSNIVYAALAPGPILSLSKQLMVVPHQSDIDTAEVPFVSLLESRWTMTESLRLPLPITERSPSLPEAPVGKVSLIPQFTFTLGYVIEDQPLALDEHNFPDGSRQLRVEYGALIQRQRLKRSAPVTADIPALITEMTTNIGIDD